MVGHWSGLRLEEFVEQQGCELLPQDVSTAQVSRSDQEVLRFLALGDTGTGTEDQQQVAEGMRKVCAAQGCDFVLLLGDNFYEGGVASVNDPLWESRFANVYSALHIPFFAALGNHDIRQSGLSQVLYSLKNPQWQMPNFQYEFKAGPAGFYALNTNCHLFGWQTLHDKLAEKKDKWVFVYGHHPLYSGGLHGDADWSILGWWQFRLHDQVDFYLAGHDHHLQHLQQEGVTTEYIVSGAGGRHYREAAQHANFKPSHAQSRFVYQDTGFVGFEVTDSTVTVKYYNQQGQELYGFTKTKER